MAIGKRQRFRILERDGFKCNYCGRMSPDVALHVDHVVARSRGGSNDDDNLVTACADCNLGKANQHIIDPREWRFEEAYIVHADDGFDVCDPALGMPPLTI